MNEREKLHFFPASKKFPTILRISKKTQSIKDPLQPPITPPAHGSCVGWHIFSFILHWTGMGEKLKSQKIGFHSVVGWVDGGFPTHLN